MPDLRAVVLVSAEAEWAAIKELCMPLEINHSPFGEFYSIFDHPLTPDSQTPFELFFFQGGWGKIAAAASTQYVLDEYTPDLLINLGTCGGFRGRICRGTVILVTKTLVYDIHEQMSDPEEAVAHFSTTLDLSWLDPSDFGPDEFKPFSLVRSLLVSADRDLRIEDITVLEKKYGAIAADWESGAIAWVCKRNKTRILILRAVTDLVDSSGGEAYGDIDFFRQNTKKVMGIMVERLLAWLDTCSNNRGWNDSRDNS